MKQFLHVFVLVTLVIGFSSPLKAQSNGFEEIKSMELMDLIFQQLETNYVDEIKPGEMSKTAIDAMLKQLDPYTVYYHESNMEDYRMMTTGQYGGIGALIRKMGDYTYIAEPYEGKPAQLAGVLAGDKILSIDGKDMKGKASDDVSDALRGPKGSAIQVKVERDGQEKTISITRDEIKLADVPYFGMLNNGTIGYIKLNSFTQTASAEVMSAFGKLKQQGMTSLILDLRGNGGGLLFEAVKIVNMFVKKGQTVVTTKGRIPEENRTYATPAEPVDLTIPLAVLVDGGSASASEIVAGSLQDLDRAVIIGTNSFGKGLVQRTFDLKYGSKIKLTISKYYTPSGRCVQRLEYYDKELGEKPKAIADSLLKSFKTANGRKVIDGRGIEPDIVVDQNDYSRLLIMLVSNNVIFNYATDFKRSHPTIGPATTFKLTPEEYEVFKTYALKQTFTYSTASEEQLEKMKKTAEDEGYFDDIKTDYDQLLSKVTPSKERDLDKFKDEINNVLSSEIVSRYYYQNGRAEQAFQADKNIQKALEILSDSKQLNTILGK
ncbi:S41 family peptidase [Fluviicola sp.]|jgi:carboxyl-terminal processing protease|uniref:S41 family peptidase n=1 Tax=Fluviicola sp. TaxID=1917219 RepID=UPI00281F6603|nr:S41 family peptidase [Fluviicola sp.]MDR0801439.1 S41 family peptidase [Fluviicola sp.]